jgi:ParB family chromosome partitioning protein
MREKDCSRAQAFRIDKRRKESRRSLREKILAEPRQFSSVIKPSDNWDFSRLLYPRIDDSTGDYGYIPGDLYANALFYFARPGDLVVAPMAGRGQVHHVYLDRAVWTKGLPQPWEIDLRMFDLVPRGRYSALIGQHDLLTGFPPVERAPDYVIMDVPYLGLCKHQYSRQATDLANMDEAGWTAAMHKIACTCAEVQAKRCTIITPNWVDVRNEGHWRSVLCAEIVRAAWVCAGYRLVRVCYSSCRIQQHGGMPRWNSLARVNRVPLSDMTEVLTFDR